MFNRVMISLSRTRQPGTGEAKSFKDMPIPWRAFTAVVTRAKVSGDHYGPLKVRANPTRKRVPLKSTNNTKLWKSVFLKKKPLGINVI